MKPMNLLVIMSDQHSRNVLGCYGNQAVHTPNLDALAASGTTFANAYTPTPICVPARASFATGRYAHQIESWDNAKPYIGTEAESWGHRLTEQGHQVTTIGKLHYRNPEDPTGFPDQRIPMHILDGLGDIYALLREEMPVRPQSRKHVVEAGPGESDYIRYDRAITREAQNYLSNEASDHAKPWALFVSLVTPHFPLVVPEEYYERYADVDLPMPAEWRPEEWPQHPALQVQRRTEALEEPFDDATIKKAMAAYYGMVTFLDEQIGTVLRALDESGQRDRTRILYVSDHGEMLGAHGLWWKSTMYDEAAAVPMILAGPDVPAGKIATTNVSLVDVFPSVLEAVGASPAPADADLPGESLWEIAREDHQPRTAFSEYHTIFSSSARYLLRDDDYKYVHYVGFPAQLFDVRADPEERHDLAADPAHAPTIARYEAKLRAMLDPEGVDEMAKADQRQRLAAAGGADIVRAAGVKIPYTPAPEAAYANQ